MYEFDRFIPAHVETVKLYDFDELTEKSKEHVRECKHEYLFDCDPWYQDEMFATIDKVAELYRFTYKCESPYDFKYDFWLKSNEGESDYCYITGARAYAWLENNVFNDLRVKPKFIKSTFPAEGYYKENGCDGFKDCPFTGVFYDDCIYDARKEFIERLRKDKNTSVQDFFNIFMNLVASEFESECEARDSDEFIGEWEALEEIKGYETDGTPWTSYDLEKAGYTEKENVTA